MKTINRTIKYIKSIINFDIVIPINQSSGFCSGRSRALASEPEVAKNKLSDNAVKRNAVFCEAIIQDTINQSINQK